jgi:hypothetical protein
MGVRAPIVTPDDRSSPLPGVLRTAWLTRRRALAGERSLASSFAIGPQAAVAGARRASDRAVLMSQFFGIAQHPRAQEVYVPVSGRVSK